MAVDEEVKAREPIYRDTRTYYCEFCGICRSKTALIAAQIRTHHEEEFKEKELNEEQEHGGKLNVCEECGASFGSLRI